MINKTNEVKALDKFPVNENLLSITNERNRNIRKVLEATKKADETVYNELVTTIANQDIKSGFFLESHKVLAIILKLIQYNDMIEYLLTKL
jgi:hypothetical protein